LRIENQELNKIGLGGSCHWCTEAIFQSLKGVLEVQQGWISSIEYPSFSEAVIVIFDECEINLNVLIEIHLRTHSATSSHSMREKYRSAVYCFSEDQTKICTEIIASLQDQFDKTIITKALLFDSFKLNTENYLDYYRKNPEKPFCRNVIDPKLTKLRNQFSTYVKHKI